MKTFKKICLKSVSNSLSDQEMRRYVGGYEDGYGEGYSIKFCPEGQEWDWGWLRCINKEQQSGSFN